MIDLHEIGNKLERTTLIAYDTETSGLDWRTCHACGYVLTFDVGDTVYLPVRHQGGGNLDPELVESMIRFYMSRPNLNVIMHNAAFDLKFAAKHDIHFGGNVYCTQTMAAMCDEHSHSFSLNWLTQQYKCETHKRIDIYDYLANKFGVNKADKNLMSRYHELTGDDVMAVTYACTDGDATIELYHKLVNEITAQEMERVWACEHQLTKILHEMSWRGMKIDEEELAEVIKTAENLKKTAESVLPANLNAKSPLQMEKLFTDAGMKNFPRTATGRSSFPESWLMTNELGQKVVAVRKWGTLLSSFLMPIRDRHLHRGRLHTNFNQLKADEFGTISGRISSNDPNILNFPSPNRQPEQGKLIRRIFIADEGQELGEADYSQCEPRLVAHYAEIPSWRRGYNSTPPMDAHTAVAQTTGLLRQRAKTINMALITGAGTDKIIGMLGMPHDEGKRTVDAYHRGVPQVKAFQRKAASIWERRGWVKSILGRRFHLDEPRYAYRALSRIIQGSNADIMKLAMVKCSKINDVELLNSVYDSLMWQTAYHDKHQEVINEMINMDELKLSVPMVVDFGHGQRWSDCEK